MFLFAPYGISTGFVTLTLGFLLTRAGVSAETVGEIVSVSLIPQIFKILWAPLVDTTLTCKRWVFLSALVTGLGRAYGRPARVSL